MQNSLYQSYKKILRKQVPQPEQNQQKLILLVGVGVISLFFSITGLLLNQYYRDHLPGQAATIGDGTAALHGTQTTSSTNLNQSTAFAISWSSSDVDGTYFSHSTTVNPQRLTIQTAGDYLVAATLPMTSGVSQACVHMEVYVNGTARAGSIGESSYIRNQSGHTESSDHSSVLLRNLAANDYIEVFVNQSASAGTVTVSGQASLFAEYIGATRTVFSGTATRTTNSTNLNQATAYPLQWTEGRKNSGFTHSDATNSQNIQLDAAGNYLVFVNIPLNSTDRRTSSKLIVQLDGVTVPGGEGKQGYIRDQSGHNDSSVHWSGVVSSSSANQTLTVQTQQEARAGTTTVQTGKVGSIYVEQLPSTDIYFGRGTALTGGTNWNPAAAQSVLWSTDDIIDTGIYTHSTSVNSQQVEVESAGDYLLVYNDSLTSAVQRTNTTVSVAVNGSAISGAQTKSHYIRNRDGHAESSGTLVYYLEDLAANDLVTVNTVQEAAAGTVDDDQNGLLFLWYKPSSSPLTDQLHFRWRDDSTDLNTSGGWIAAEDTNGIIAASAGDDYRLRMEVANTGNSAESAARTYELQWGELSTTCDAIATWTGVANASDEIDMNATTHIDPDGETATLGLLANSETYTYTSGEGRESADTTGSIGPLSASYYTELEYSITPTASTSKGTTYCFRLYDTTAGAVLDDYSIYPTITMQSDGLKVQTIIGTLSGATSDTVTIPDEINSTDRAFLLFDFGGEDNGDNTPSEGSCTAYISSTTEITVEKSSATGSCDYAIYVVEALNNEFIVKGRSSISMSGTQLSNTGVANNLGNIYDTSNVFVPGMARSDGNGNNEWCETFSTLELTGQTTVTATRGNNTGTDTSVLVRYEVVEWMAPGVSVQTTERTLTNLSTTAQTDTIDTSVTTSRAFVYATYRHASDGVAQNTVRTELQNGTTVRFDRASGTGYTSYARWWAIEYPASTVTVIRGTGTQAAPNADIDINLPSTATLGKSFPIVYSSNSDTGNPFPQGLYSSNLDTTTHIDYLSGRSGDTTNYAWQVIDTSPWIYSAYLPIAPTALYSNNTTAQTGQTDPIGLTDTTPAFSAVFQDPDSGDITDQAWIQVSTDSTFASVTHWDSGEYGTAIANTTTGSRSPDIFYGSFGTAPITNLALNDGAVTYYWRIKFWDDEGYEGLWSANGTFTLQDIPTAPSSAAFTDVQTDSLTFNWTDNSSGESTEENFEIDHSTDGVLYALLHTNLAEDNDDTHSGLSPNTIHYYRIRATNTAGNSAYTTPISAYTAANVPGAPILSNTDYGILHFIVDTNSNPASTEYAIAVSTDDFVTDTRYIQDDNTLGPVLGAEDWQTYANWGGLSGEDLTGLISGQEYFFKVMARNNDDLETVYSDTVSVTNWTTPSLTLLVEGTALGDVDLTGLNDEIPFGFAMPGTSITAVQKLTVETNALSGYTASIKAGAKMAHDEDVTIDVDFIRNGLVGTNTWPVAWTSPTGTAIGNETAFVGYHTSDILLGTGTVDRFAPADTWAGFDTLDEFYEVLHLAGPTDGSDDGEEYVHVTFKFETNNLHPSGNYSDLLLDYQVVPVF